MKKITALILTLPLLFSGCVKMANDPFGKITAATLSKKDRTSGKMSKFEVDCAAIRMLVNHTALDVRLEEGDPHVTVTGPAEQIDKIRIVKNGYTVEIRADGQFSAAKNITIKVTTPHLSDILWRGAGDLSCPSYTATQFTITNQGSGDMKFDTLKTTSFKMNMQGLGDVSITTFESTGGEFIVRGSGDVKIANARATTFDTLLQGSGDLEVKNLKATVAEIHVQGSGDVSLPAVEVTGLKVVSQGAGDVTVGGTANTANFLLQGSGDINARKLKASRLSKSVQGAGDLYL